MMKIMKSEIFNFRTAACGSECNTYVEKTISLLIWKNPGNTNMTDSK